MKRAVVVGAGSAGATLAARLSEDAGTSVLNAMIAIRGTPDDYDRGADELGCAGWSWSELMPIFLAVEDDADLGGDGRHGLGGPIPLMRTPDVGHMPLDAALRIAAASLGYPHVDDYHAPGATGLSRAALTVRNGARVSTNDAYLESARSRPNLTIRGMTHVDRVALDGSRAVGVVTAAGEEIEADVVLLCAGAIHSPAILLRSGIGPERGLPVGENLVDHASFAGFELKLTEPGRLASARLPVLSSLIRYSSGLADAGPNDMQILWFNAVGATDNGLRGARLFAAAMRVFSRGSVRLRSEDPLDDPIVEFHMLSDERDAVRLRDARPPPCEHVSHHRRDRRTDRGRDTSVGVRHVKVVLENPGDAGPADHTILTTATHIPRTQGPFWDPPEHRFRPDSP